MSANKSFFQLINERKEALWAPCIWDCMSARVAEATGFEAATISSSEMRDALTGGRMRGLLSMDEMLFACERIAKSTGMAVFADTESGGANPMDTYKNIKRFAEAGIMAVNIEDEAAVRVGTTVIDGQCFLSAEQWAMHVQAAVEAVKGTDCMVIARTNCKGGGSKKFAKGYFGIKPEDMLGLDEAIRRGIYTSVDINYRKNLWKYGQEARDVLFPAVKACHIVFGDTGEWELITGMKVPKFEARDTHYKMDLKAYKEFFDKAGRWIKGNK